MGNPFAGLNAIGHMLPAVPIWLMGFYKMLLHFDVLKQPARLAKNTNYLSWALMSVGAVYALIHFSIVLTATTARQHMDNMSHTNIGVSLAFGGFLHWLMSKPGMQFRTVNFGIPFAFIGPGLVLLFHDNHTHADGSEDVAGNRIHAFFALSMIGTGILNALCAVYRRWTPVECIFFIMSGAVLASSSDWVMDSVSDNAFGVGNLIIVDLYFALAHLVGVLLFLQFSGRAARFERLPKHGDGDGDGDGDGNYSQDEDRFNRRETSRGQQLLLLSEEREEIDLP
jgi:hypothetical protein